MSKAHQVPRAQGWTVRVVVQTYDAEAHAYREAGMSVAGVLTRSDEELARLWILLQEVIEDRRWTDRFQATVRNAGPVPDVMV